MAALPPRVANARLRRVSGRAWSACGAQGRIDHPATDHAQWRTDTEAQGNETVAALVRVGGAVAQRRLESAMDGVNAQIDGRGPEPKGAPMLVRWLPGPPQEPTRGTVVARRYLGILGSAEALVTRIKQRLRDAGWEQLPVAEILGDGAPWMGHVAEVHVPGGGRGRRRGGL